MAEESTIFDENKSSTDYISALPDHLILHEIFCYLAFDDILRTSCLSKRWRYLWALPTYLNFDVDEMHSLSERNAIIEQPDDDGDADDYDYDYDDDGEGDDNNDGDDDEDNDGEGDNEGDEDHYDSGDEGGSVNDYDDSYDDIAAERRRRLVNSVNLVLSISKEPLQAFSLLFDPLPNEHEDHSLCVTKWIDILQSRRLEYLGLDFSERGYLCAKNNPQYELPIQLFHFERLETLDLTYCRLQLPSSGSECIALKFLKLDRVFVTDEDMNERLIPNVPLLETLVLRGCQELTRLDIPPELSKLKTLNVTFCYRIDEIKADSHNLERFYYYGQLIRFSVSKLAPLVQVDLNFTCGYASRNILDDWFHGRPYHDLTFIMRMLPLWLPHVENLQVTIRGLKLMVPNKERIPDKPLPSFANLKVLGWYICSQSEVDFCYLMHILQSCPLLEELNISFIELTGGTSFEPSYEDIFHERNKEIWVPPHAIHLGPIKNIYIKGFTVEKNQLELCRFLLNKCSLTLELLTIKPSRNTNSWYREVADLQDVDEYYSKAQAEFLSMTIASPSSPTVVFHPLDLRPGWLYLC